MLTDCERNLPHGKKMNIEKWRIRTKNKRNAAFVSCMSNWAVGSNTPISQLVCLSKADWIAKTLKQTLIPCFLFLLHRCFDMADALLYLLAAPHSDNSSIDDLRRCSCCCFVFRSVFFLLEIRRRGYFPHSGLVFRFADATTTTTTFSLRADSSVCWKVLRHPSFKYKYSFTGQCTNPSSVLRYSTLLRALFAHQKLKSGNCPYAIAAIRSWRMMSGCHLPCLLLLLRQLSLTVGDHSMTRRTYGRTGFGACDATKLCSQPLSPSVVVAIRSWRRPAGAARNDIPTYSSMFALRIRIRPTDLVIT